MCLCCGRAWLYNDTRCGAEEARMPVVRSGLHRDGTRQGVELGIVWE